MRRMRRSRAPYKARRTAAVRRVTRRIYRRRYVRPTMRMVAKRWGRFPRIARRRYKRRGYNPNNKNTALQGESVTMVRKGTLSGTTVFNSTQPLGQALELNFDGLWLPDAYDCRQQATIYDRYINHKLVGVRWRMKAFRCWYRETQILPARTAPIACDAMQVPWETKLRSCRFGWVPKHQFSSVAPSVDDPDKWFHTTCTPRKCFSKRLYCKMKEGLADSSILGYQTMYNKYKQAFQTYLLDHKIKPFGDGDPVATLASLNMFIYPHVQLNPVDYVNGANGVRTGEISWEAEYEVRSDWKCSAPNYV